MGSVYVKNGFCYLQYKDARGKRHQDATGLAEAQRADAEKVLKAIETRRCRRARVPPRQRREAQGTADGACLR